MQIRIAGAVYDVRISPRPIIREGEPCRAWCDHGRRLILISEQVPRDGRDRVLRHEAWHAWAHERGLPADPGPELLADEVAAYSAAIQEAIDAAGGSEVLHALDVDPGHAQPGRGAVLLTDRAECPHCGASVMVGSIATSPAEWMTGTSVWRVTRGCRCEICDTVWTWAEQALADGTPLGLPLPSPPPRVLTGAAAADWLRRNAGVARVVTV